MKKIVSFAALLLAGASAFAATPSETVEAFHNAIHAGDQARALELLSPSIVIYESGHVERSRDEYMNHHLGADMEFAKTTKRKVVKHSERIEGNLATVLDETETSGEFKGKPVRSLGVETAVLEKKGDGWVIVHVHWSSRKPK